MRSRHHGLWTLIPLALGFLLLPRLQGRWGHRKPGSARAPTRKRGVIPLVKATVESWVADRAPKMAAALAYYTAFAVAPLLLISIAVAGLVFGRESARDEVMRQLSGLIGDRGAGAIGDLVEHAWQPKASLIATVVGIVALLLAASGVFGELQDSLNLIWKVKKKPGRGLWGLVKDRFLSFSMVLGIGFLLLVSLVVSAGLQALGHALTSWGGEGFLIRALNEVISFGVVGVIFAAIFRVLPDARTRWRDLWIGAAFSAFLFTVGKYLIGLYLGRSTIGSTYGAAGSFVVFLLWVNYSAQILFLGAEFTRTYAELRGTRPGPDPDAVPIEGTPTSPSPEPRPRSA